MRTLFFMGVIIALGLYLSQQEGFENGFFARIKANFGGKTELVIAIPQNIILHEEHKNLSVPLVLRLTNNTDAVEALTAPPCKEFRFLITTAGDAFKQSAGSDENCPATTATSRALGKGEVLQDLRQIFLETKRYQAGDYKLRVRFWGYEAEKTFSLVPPE
ncbi:MAG: hypothetical protein HAW65_07110 [Alphaproteobacteria bacterium]|nr:hypothetical protein [Alphaproteobacteria bacterium]